VTPTTTPLRVVLGEYDIGWHDPATSLDRASAIVSAAAASGARFVVLPEMCTTGFTMDAELAEPLAGESVARLSKMASRSGLWLLAGVATRDDDHATSTARNSALIFTPTGELAAVYHKQRLFAYANEQRTYVSGERAVVVDIDGVRVSPFICYDLRFPELFRAVAADTDLMVVIASWPAARRAHWDALLRARAIENQCYVIGVNRTGVGDSIVYDGGSVAYDPWGIALDRSVVAHAADVTSVTVSAGEVKRVRGAYPFLADRR
jgi:omega-amidase